MKRILIIEDDPVVNMGLARNLNADGYIVTPVLDGAEGARYGLTRDYEAAILDLGLPGKNGKEILSEWRRAGREMPVVVYSVRKDSPVKTELYKTGADVYVVKEEDKVLNEEQEAGTVKVVDKTARYSEVKAALDAVLRRSGYHEVYQYKGLELDVDARELTYKGERIKISKNKLKFLHYLWARSPRLATRRQLAELIWGYDGNEKESQLDQLVSPLRKLLPAELGDIIQTERGDGYKMKLDS